MKLAKYLLVVLALCCMNAYADTIETFAIQGTGVYPYHTSAVATVDISGYVVMDVDTYIAQFVFLDAVSYDLSGNQTGSVTYSDSNPVSDGALQIGHTGLYRADTYDLNADYALQFPVVPGTPYSGGALCETSLSGPACGINVYSGVTVPGVDEFDIESGTLTPAPAITPEPSSLVLLGSGAFMVFGVARRRVFA